MWDMGIHIILQKTKIGRKLHCILLKKKISDLINPTKKRAKLFIEI